MRASHELKPSSILRKLLQDSSDTKTEFRCQPACWPLFGLERTLALQQERLTATIRVPLFSH